VLAEWQASGQSVAAFGRERGLDPVRLLRWRKRLEARTTSLGLVPVTVGGAATIRIERARVVAEVGVMRIEVHDVGEETAAWIARLARAMERAS
jgi:hypothetical protein